MLLPEPETPVTHVSNPSGNFVVIFLRLCLSAPTTDTNPFGLRRRVGSVTNVSPRRYFPVNEAGSAITCFGVPCAMMLPAMCSCPRSHIDNMVGRRHGLCVVLDDNDRIAEIAQSNERLQQPTIIALMKPDRRLVQNVEDTDESRPDLRGEPNALPLTARQRGGGAIQRQIIQADVIEKAQPFANFLQDPLRDESLSFGQFQGFKKVSRRPNRKPRHIGDRLLIDFHRQTFRFEARAMADGA